jgi:5-methylcytosine-specific restriction protein A
VTGRWASSNRRAELPPDWPARKVKVRERSGGQCEVEEDEVRCPRPGRDVDHIGDPHDHSLDNLQDICGPHHDAKTQQQAAAARAAIRAKAVRPKPKHPGLY